MARIPSSRILEIVPLALAGWVVWLVMGTWVARWSYPFDLEWMEGGMLAHAWRLQHGLELYPVPNPDFIPFVYPPGYASVLALLGQVFPLGHGLGRAVAALGTTLAAGAIVVGVKRQAGSAVIGLVAAAVFLGTYPASGAFMDLVRPDSWHVALLAWALVLGLEERRGAAVAAGLLLAASYLFKHNAAAYGVPMVLAIILRAGWRQGMVFGMSAALPALGATLYMQWVSEGRFLNYLLSVPGSHPMIWHRGFPGGAAEIGDALALPLLGCAVYLAFRAPGLARLPVAGTAALVGIVGADSAFFGYGLEPIGGVKFPPTWARVVSFGALGVAASSVTLVAVRCRAETSWKLVYGAGVGLVALATAMLMRAHHGGFINVFLPAHWVVAFSVGIVGARALRERPGWLVSAVVSVGFAGQLAWAGWQIAPEKYIPTERDRAAGAEVVEAVAQCEGPVHSPYAAWIPVQAGFAPSMHAIALWDVNHKRGPFRAHVKPLHDAAREHYWGCVVDGGSRPLGISIPEHYVRASRFSIPSGVFRPRTGWRARPTQILVPAD